MLIPTAARCGSFTRYCAVTLICLLLQPAFADESSPEASPAVPAPSENLDLRLIVDISGSMRRTDPNNLRQPAVTLFSELVPEGSQGGVWTFGRYVNMLVPMGQVDNAWRKQVQDATDKINSVALFTNIGGALEVASDDFYRDQDFSNTHFILLTDGLVSIDEAESADVAERQRILGPVLERFIEKGARIHPIALSEEADFPLLESLAVETGGQFNVANTDAELTQAMLQAFAGSASSDEVALTDNRFSIDSTVEQFTALIFRQPGSGSLSLQSPSGEALDRNDRNEDLRWLSTRDYDLITLDQPEAGGWQVAGLIGSESRIKVVSQLRMVVSELPRQFFTSDSLPLSIAFYEDGELINDTEFLSLMELTVEISTEDGRSGTRVLTEPATASGVFRDDIKLLREPGLYQVMVRADGGTFNRSHRQSTTLRPPFDVELQGQGSGDESLYRMLLRPRDPGLDLSSVTGSLSLTSPDGRVELRALEANENRTEWATEITGQAGPGEYRLALAVQGTTLQGLSVDQLMDPVLARFPRTEERSSYARVTTTNPPPAVAKVAPPPPPDPQPPAAPLFSPEPVTPPLPAETTAQQTVPGAAWLWWLGAGILTLLLVAAGLLFLRTKHSKQPLQDASGDPENSGNGDDGTDTASNSEEAIAPLKNVIDTLDDDDDDLLTGQPPELTPLPEETSSMDEEASPEPASRGDEATAADTVDDSDIPELSADEKTTSESDTDQPPRKETLSLDDDDDSDDEFSLEDFDIADIDDLPDQDSKDGKNNKVDKNRS